MHVLSVADVMNNSPRVSGTVGDGSVRQAGPVPNADFASVLSERQHVAPSRAEQPAHKAEASESVEPADKAREALHDNASAAAGPSVSGSQPATTSARTSPATNGSGDGDGSVGAIAPVAAGTVSAANGLPLDATLQAMIKDIAQTPAPAADEVAEVADGGKGALTDFLTVLAQQQGKTAADGASAAAQTDATPGVEENLPVNTDAWAKALAQLAANGAEEEVEAFDAPVSGLAEKALAPTASATKENVPDSHVVALPQGPLDVQAKSATATQALQAPDRATLATLEDATIKGVHYLVSQGDKTLTVRLVPPSLGELQIQVTSSNDTLNVKLISPNPVVRDMLESQMFNLRDALSRSGTEVVKVMVMSSMTGYTPGDSNARNLPWDSSGAASTRLAAFSTVGSVSGDASESVRRIAAHQGALDVFI